MSNPIGHLEKVRALAATARLLAVGGARAGASSQISVHDHVAGKPVRTIDVPAHVLGLAYLGDQLAAACSDGALRLYSSEGAEVQRVDAHAGGATGVAAAPAGDRLATVGADGRLCLWTPGEASETSPSAAWQLSTAPLRAVAFDPAGEIVAAAGDDGVVRAITLATGAQRDMAGHEGPVLSLAFTPRDGRLASAGEDGTARIWYLVGEVEHELRGDGGSGHAGAVNALLFLPPMPEGSDGKEVSDRFLTAGADGKVKVWRLEDRRKPRTIDAGSAALWALAFAPGAQPGLGAVFFGGDRRSVWRHAIDGSGNPFEKGDELDHGFSTFAAQLGGQRPAREAAVHALAALGEPEALELLLRALKNDKDAEVRALVARLLASHGRREARTKLREALGDQHPMVRDAAFEALRALERDHPLSPLRAALDARASELRIKALGLLPALRDVSPLVPGLIADRLADKDGSVRLAALSELMKLQPGSPEPLRTGFERGPADLRVEVLIQATSAGWLGRSELGAIVSRALDDEDPEVRRVAFAAKVLERRPLAHVLEARDEDLARTIKDIARRLAQARMGLVATLDAAAEAKGGKAKDAKDAKDSKEAQPRKVTNEAIEASRAGIPGVGEPGAPPSEADLEPLLTAMACRTPDTAVRGARGLAQLGDTRALGALLQLTREQDPALRRQAAAALQELKDSRAEKRLVWMLDDADATVRAAALDAFSRLAEGSPMLSAEAALRSSHEDIRVRGLDRLVKLPAEGAERPPEAEALLADAIEDESAKVRGEAFRTLWSWHAKDPQRALERALSARFPDLRLRAVEELKALGQEAWAQERLQATIGDRDAAVAQAAYDAVLKLRGKDQPEAHLAAMASSHAGVRTAGAKGAVAVKAESTVRSALIKQLEDQEPGPRTAALETLDHLLPNESGPIHIGLQSSHLDLRVRAAELLAVRHDERLADPMRALIADKDLARQLPPVVVASLRQRAASTLATLGTPRLTRYFATELLKDEDGQVREQAARGLAMAARRGDEGYLLDALGHRDIAVRSWAADGLARLGDVRALPVLTGTLRHEHPPIRIATIMSFAALGPEGYGGMLQGLEDPAREVQEIVFAIVMARDLRAFRRGEPPDLLTSALSSQRADVRFAAARALELRTDPEFYLMHLIEVLMPPKPEKSADMKNWPAEQERARILVGLAEALAGDNPEQRYAAAQTLRLRSKAIEYFREARRVGQLRPAGAAYVADTTPRGPEETDAAPQKGWLRRLFARGAEMRPPEAEAPPAAAGVAGKARGMVRRLFGKAQDAVRPSAPPSEPGVVPEAEQKRLRWLAFGAYLGLLRQVASGDDEGHRVRRDAIDRIVDLCAKGHVSETAAIPPLVRALDDPHHLVRKAALAGLEALFPAGSEEPLSLSLASGSADVARAALDELAQRSQAARPRIVRALNSPVAEVRRYAFEILERMSPKGSLDPLLAALGSDHADLRLGVLDRLASSSDPRIVPALHRAMASEHDDLRLRAAELTARRRDDRAVDVLAAFLRADTPAAVSRAREALVALGSAAAVRALAARIEELGAAADRSALTRALGATRSPEALEPIVGRFEDEAAEVRSAAFQAALDVVGAPWGVDRRPPTQEDAPKTPDAEATRRALDFLRAAARAKDPALRLAAARELVFGDDAEAADLLAPLFSDRDPQVRIAAVAAYAKRVIEKNAPVAPLEAVLRAGARELMLAAAEAVAARQGGAALRPLLLFSRAGEGGERERALLALGTLGDTRALEELETVAGGGTKEAPVEGSMQAAATEALGRIAARLSEDEARRRVVGRVEQALDAEATDLREAAARGLRWIGGERARVLLEKIANNEEAPDSLRVTAATQLGLIADAAAEPVLARLLDAWSPTLRRAARRALEKLFPEDRMRVELLAVGSEREDIAEPAAAYLAREADPAELVPRLGTLKNESLRARLTLGLLQRPSLPTGALVKLLEDERPSARKDAAYLVASRTGALPDAGGEAAVAPVSAQDQAAIAAALVAAERRTAERWAKALPRDRAAEAAAWRDLVWAARRIGAQEARAALRGVVQGGDAAAPAEIRREAARALGALGALGAPGKQPEEASAEVEALTAALKDLDPEVRRAAAASLAALSPTRAARTAVAIQPLDPVAFEPTAAAATPAIRAELAASEPGRRLALPTMLAAHETAPLLALARDAKDTQTRLDAIAALGRTDDQDALSLLASLAFDKKAVDLPMRKAAYRAYRRAKRRAEKAEKARARRQQGAGAEAGGTEMGTHGANA